jgi:hypothetical protein
MSKFLPDCFITLSQIRFAAVVSLNWFQIFLIEWEIIYQGLNGQTAHVHKFLLLLERGGNGVKLLEIKQRGLLLMAVLHFIITSYCGNHKYNDFR